MTFAKKVFNYRHVDLAKNDIGLPVGKVVCVGRNYLLHIKELNNPVPEKPLLFIKPATSLVDLNQAFAIPQNQGECQNEIEIAVLIKDELQHVDESEVEQAIWGYGLGLDLTLRDLQSELKKAGHPWERSKAFDGSCPISPFVEKAKIVDQQNIDFRLSVNGYERQVGNTSDMLMPINHLLSDISKVFTLLPGDIVLTGTPQGVGPLNTDDLLELQMGQFFCLSTGVK